MKRVIAAALLLVCALGAVTGCGKQANKDEEMAINTQIGNPWSDWSSIGEAEAETGFAFGLPETVANTFHADVIRTMNGTLIEVVYRYEGYEVCVRKQKGEGEDISGDYNQYAGSRQTERNGGVMVEYYNADNSAVKQNISCQGYSWSLVAPQGYWGDSNEDFLALIFR